MIANACDCHIHVFEDGRALAPTATFRPPHAPASDYAQVQRDLGLQRVVIVQPTGYGFDNDCTLGAMRDLGPGARGVAVVPPDVPQQELQRLHDAGMRGVRFMMLPGGVLPWSALPVLAERIAPLAWNINLQLDGHELPQHEAMLHNLPCRLVIDHIGKFLGAVTLQSDGFDALRRLLDAGNTWVKLSAPYESSREGPPDYADIAPLVRELAASHTDRCLWASNWPHPNVSPHPSNKALADWALALMGSDANRQRILADNPGYLYGF